jgi:aminopeptidase N
MTGGNLTRDEAAERARLLSGVAYRVGLDLTQGETTFRSISTITFACAEPGASSFLDLLAPSVRSVILNGTALDVATVFDGARIRLDALQPQNTVIVDADCAYSRTGEGLYRFVDPADKQVYTYTQFEPADARRLYANFEQPDLKGVFEFVVTAQADWRVWSNASVASVAGADSADGSGTPAKTWRFEPTKPISTYITAVVAGPYHYVEEQHTVRLPSGDDLEIPLGVLCRASLAEFLDADAIFDVTKSGLDFFHQIFDYPYPFGKYDQAFVPEYNLGAMENPGLVTFTERYVFRSKTTDASYQGRANTILHEMAHMWFGDLVTMKWWDDLWLKESFADFMGSFACVEATRWKGDWVSFANRRKAWAYRQDQLPTTHPIVADIGDLEDAKLNFDGITYAKGASVLKQLVAYVGRDAFLEGARRYFKDNAFGNTTLADLLSALEETSGRDLLTWSAAWLETAGVNTLTPELDHDQTPSVVGGRIIQTAPAEWPTLRPHRVAVGCYRREPRPGGRLQLVKRFELDVVGEVTEMPQVADTEGHGAYDLVLLNDLDLTYAKVQFEPDDLHILENGGIGDLDDSMARALCWSGLWHMTRDGVMPGRKFVDTVFGNIGGESDIGVVQNLLLQVKTVLSRYVDPAGRAAAKQRAGQAVWRLLDAAAAGGDHQVAYAYAAAWATNQDSDFDRLAGLLAGTVRIEGLTVDQDLRWAYVEALAAAGRDDSGALADAEADRDHTSAGRRHHAAALASRPLAAAKADAWRDVVETPDQPNELIAAVLTGFEQPGQEKLLEPYVEPYFAGLATWWRDRSIENAERLVNFGYPGLLASSELLARTDDWLASDAAKAPALCRLVVECRDDIARALRAQECDRLA